MINFLRQIRRKLADDNRIYIFNPSAASVDYLSYYDLTVEELYEVMKEQYNDHLIPNGLMIYRNNHPKFNQYFTDALNKISVLDSLITLHIK